MLQRLENFTAAIDQFSEKNFSQNNYADSDEIEIDNVQTEQIFDVNSPREIELTLNIGLFDINQTNMSSDNKFINIEQQIDESRLDELNANSVVSIEKLADISIDNLCDQYALSKDLLANTNNSEEIDASLSDNKTSSDSEFERNCITSVNEKYFNK